MDAISCIVLIGPDGVVVGRFLGYHPGIKDAVREEIAKLLGEEPEPEEVEEQAEPADADPPAEAG